MKFKYKKELLLKLLYEKRFDGKYYSIGELFIEEKIIIELQEEFQLADSLLAIGHITGSKNKLGTSCRINYEGIEWIEDNINLEEYYGPRERKEISEKLDEFGKSLKELKLGQQVIYDDFHEEFQELKRLLGLLRKKEWIAIFKGVLIQHHPKTCSEL